MQDWLTQRTRASPERTALVRASTGEKLDFAGLDQMVDDLSGRLRALGVDADDHLGMVMETRLAAVCTVHAADRLGAVFVPIGHELTPRELTERFDAADVTAVVCSERTEASVSEAFDGAVCSVDETTTERADALGDVTPVAVDPAEWSREETRLLMFTSGTTGTPKAVELTVGNLVDSAVASATRLGLHGDDRWLVCLSLHHVGGLSPVLRMPLYGMTVVLRGSFDAGRTADDIGSHGVTCVSLVPTMLTRMLNLRGTLSDSLRVVLLGGAPAPDELIGRCRDFSVPVYPTYGMTETASQVATATPKESFRNVGTVGRPLFGTTVSVRDEDGVEVPDGTLGELVVDGPTVSPGYYGDPEATGRVFGANGLRTGDLGYRDEDGRLYVEGRLDDRINTGGENVHPHEVVDVLEGHSGVTDAVVVGVPDDEWGERVGALVVASDEELTVKALDEHCRERLASFKLPRLVTFADELPRTDSGTVDRDAVRELLASVGTVPDAEESAGEAPTDDPAEGSAERGAMEATAVNGTPTGDTDGPESDDGRGSQGSNDVGEGPRRGQSGATEPTHIEDAEADDGDEGGRSPDTESTVFSSGSGWQSGHPSVDGDEEENEAEPTPDAVSEESRAEEGEESDGDEPPETPGFVKEALALDDQSSGDEGREDAVEPGAAGDATAEDDDEDDGDERGGREAEDGERGAEAQEGDDSDETTATEE